MGFRRSRIVGHSSIGRVGAELAPAGHVGGLAETEEANSQNRVSVAQGAGILKNGCPPSRPHKSEPLSLETPSAFSPEPLPGRQAEPGRLSPPATAATTTPRKRPSGFDPSSPPGCTIALSDLMRMRRLSGLREHYEDEPVLTISQHRHVSPGDWKRRRAAPPSRAFFKADFAGDSGPQTSFRWRRPQLSRCPRSVSTINQFSQRQRRQNCRLPVHPYLPSAPISRQWLAAWHELGTRSTKPCGRRRAR